MSGLPQTSNPPLIPNSGDFTTLQVDRLKINEIDADELDVEVLNATNAVFTTTVHDSLEVSNTIVVSGSVTATQMDAFQYLFTGQSVEGAGIVKDALYTGTQAPFGDKLFYKAPNNFFQLITPVTSSSQFTDASDTIVLTAAEGVGFVHSDSRFIVTPTAQTDNIAHSFNITIVQNTETFTGAAFGGNGTVTVKIIPALAAGQTLDFNWHLDGRLEITPP